MYPKLLFDSSFIKLPNSTYSFAAKNVELFDNTSWNCEGALIGADLKVSDKTIWKLPEACKDENIVKHVLQSWHDDCKHVFVKPLSLSSLQEKVTHKVDITYPIVALSPDEETQEWILLWTITKIDISKTLVTFYWAPTHKKPSLSRINESFDQDNIMEIQDPEYSQYRIIDSSKKNNAWMSNPAWVQDISLMPLSDRPALRLEAELDNAKERFRRRIRDARLRAKLAKYRAERMAQQFQEKYGVYPIEDSEEAQTEYGSSSEDS